MINVGVSDDVKSRIMEKSFQAVKTAGTQVR